MSEPVCRVRAAVYLRGGPHDGAATPPVFAVESATETVDIPETILRDTARLVRYRFFESANGGSCVLLIYQFDGYVTLEDTDGMAHGDTVGGEETPAGPRGCGR